MVLNRAVSIAISGILFPVLLYSCKGKTDGGAGTKGGKRPAITVNGYIAQSQNITSTVNASGTLLSNEEVEIKPELQARVIKVYFKEGAAVSKGQLLIKLDDADIVAQLKKLKAQKKLTQKNIGRLEELLKIDGVSKQEYDISQTQLSAYDADIEGLENQLRKTEIRAPFSGTIGLTDISEGTYVTPLNTISTLQQTHPLKIDFSIPEKYALLVKNDKILHFTVDGIRDTLTATVYAKEPKVDPLTRTIKIRARCPNPEGKLVPGMFANIQLGIGNRQNAVMIPSQALIPVARGKNVAVSRGGKVAMVAVETGIRDENLAEITHGLQAGDTVITTGLMQLREGSDVKITKLDK